MSAGLVTDSGLANLSLGIYALATGSQPLYLQFGTGSGQAVTDVGLAAPVEDRVLASSYSRETTNNTDDTFRVVGRLTAATDAHAVTEMGVFLPGGADMLFYGDFAAIDLALGDGIVFQVDVLFDQG